ncbi:MAG: shikimate kinase [Actinomycetota bacterium]|nr:shikimate kinase [Nocardioidaceae bacterium]MDQ3593091.1 shikimate kinase [Actinomycetota bacterium]
MSPVVVLVGPPGAGKTSVATRLAAALGTTVRDTDADVEAAAGVSVADIFFDHGEQYFRGLEAVAVTQALAEHDGVLALGGGAVLDPATREALCPHRVVLLDVGLAESGRRVGLGVSRPLLMGNVRGQLKALLDQRRPLYLEVADHVVPTDGRDVETVVAAVLAVLEVPADRSEPS